MDTTEYAKYEASVARFLSENHVKPGCYGPACDMEAGEEPEPFFSWSACECCGSQLGGNRETYRFVAENPAGNYASLSNPDTSFEADICTDCVYYLAYGRLDDMTMLKRP
jgi:hypothetical protein